VSGDVGRLEVLVKPGAKAPGIVLGADGVLVVRVREPAIEGRANEAVRKALATWIGVPGSRVALMRGARSKRKVFSVEGLSRAELERRILGVEKKRSPGHFNR
jgi:hypothetical protein